MSIERHILGLQSDGVRCCSAGWQQFMQTCVSFLVHALVGQQTAASSALRPTYTSRSLCSRPRSHPACASRQMRVPWQTARQSGQRLPPHWSVVWRPWRPRWQPGTTAASDCAVGCAQEAPSAAGIKELSSSTEPTVVRVDTLLLPQEESTGSASSSSSSQGPRCRLQVPGRRGHQLGARLRAGLRDHPAGLQLGVPPQRVVPGAAPRARPGSAVPGRASIYSAEFRGGMPSGT